MIKIMLKQHIDFETKSVSWSWKFDKGQGKGSGTLSDCMLGAIETMHQNGAERKYIFKMNHYLSDFWRVGVRGKHMR